jgi:hypothetical protein
MIRKKLFALPIRTPLTINEKREKGKVPIHHHINRQIFALPVRTSLMINDK